MHPHHHHHHQDVNHLAPVAGGYGVISAPKFNRKHQHQQQASQSDSENENISKWDPRRSSVNAGHLKTSTKEDVLESRRKSVFDESSSEEASYGDGINGNGRRLTVDLHNASNNNVNANMMNLNKY